MSSRVRQEERFGFGVQASRGLELVRGRGATVWDSDGNSYLDCVGGHGTAAVGHANEAVADAVSRQAATLISCPGAFANDQRARLMARLAESAPGNLNRVFFCNSGTEAVEGALKFARFATGRTNFVAARGGFHGRTFGAMSATFTPAYRRDFEPLVPGFAFAGYNDLESLGAEVDDETAAVILEVIQGEGGVVPGTREFLQGARELCDRHGALLILDEVQTGVCRTGPMFACEEVSVVPDLICLAKALAGGLPLGAVICREDLDPPVGRHGSTFGGNPLSCAAALATLDFIDENDLSGRSRDLGLHLVDGLRALDLSWARDIRGRGLMVGMEGKGRVAPVLKALQDVGVLALPAGRKVLRFLPPLTITRAEIDRVVSGVAEALASVACAGDLK
jgi:acetylornithine/LysW-gamma-L-lysine aminotransferase